MNRQKVYLAGAGPGDNNLLSIAVLKCLRQADVIVYDRLFDEEILKEAKENAEFIYVGKQSANHTMPQEEINQLLVKKAKENKIVLRLKGGDPFVFGRGGEEALVLQENGIEYEIIPGITSAIAVPCYAGIPVTHRGVAASFTVITGHEDPTKENSSHRWDKLATGADTLVFLMGVKNLSQITEKLIENGRKANTPAAIISWGTRLEQQVVVTNLENATSDAERENIGAPAVFIVGDVVNLREKLAWFDKKKLFGKKIIVTRAREQKSLLVEMLAKLGAKCVEAPAIKIIEPPDNYLDIDEKIEKLSDYNWLIFTSVNGVNAFFERLFKKNLDSRALRNIKIATIGVPTALKLKEFGIIADVVPNEFRAEGIVDALATYLQPKERILLARALKAREFLSEKLKEMGHIVDVSPVYQTIIGDFAKETVINKLEKKEIDMITFTSSSTVTNLINILGKDKKHLLNNIDIACIGPITAQTCLENEITPSIIAEEYTITGLVEAIEKHYS